MGMFLAENHVLLVPLLSISEKSPLILDGISVYQIRWCVIKYTASSQSHLSLKVILLFLQFLCNRYRFLSSVLSALDVHD